MEAQFGHGPLPPLAEVFDLLRDLKVEELPIVTAAQITADGQRQMPTDPAEQERDVQLRKRIMERLMHRAPWLLPLFMASQATIASVGGRFYFGVPMCPGAAFEIPDLAEGAANCDAEPGQVH